MLVFSAITYMDFSARHGNTRLVGLVWGWVPSLLRGSSAAEISLLIFNHYMWVGQPIYVSTLSTSLDVAAFFLSLVVGLLFR